MNPHASHSISPLRVIASMSNNRSLILGLIQREVSGRYRGSTLGILWSLFNPILMLAVYTFVFSVVFKARWAGGGGEKTEFALVLFSGLLFYNFFAECINRAPLLILSNANYVKKVIFPIEVLPMVSMGAAVFHLVISFMVWISFYVLFFGLPGGTIFMLPLVLLPLMLMTMGISWLLASLGVYLRDISQVVGILTMVLMYVSPIFYSVSALPEKYQLFMNLNPLTYIVEQARDVMMWNKGIIWGEWVKQLVFSVLIAWLGFAWFQKTRKGFADVL